jgi:hypothetical protein
MEFTIAWLRARVVDLVSGKFRCRAKSTVRCRFGQVIVAITLFEVSANVSAPIFRITVFAD